MSVRIYPRGPARATRSGDALTAETVLSARRQEAGTADLAAAGVRRGADGLVRRCRRR